MASFSLVLPDNFDDYEWEVTAKGCFSEARVECEGKQYRLNFYDHARLSQEIESRLESSTPFFEPNVVVIPSVTKPLMQHAADLLVQSGQIANMASE